MIKHTSTFSSATVKLLVLIQDHWHRNQLILITDTDWYRKQYWVCIDTRTMWVLIPRCARMIITTLASIRRKRNAQTAAVGTASLWCCDSWWNQSRCSKTAAICNKHQYLLRWLLAACEANHRWDAAMINHRCLQHQRVTNWCCLPPETVLSKECELPHVYPTKWNTCIQIPI